MFFFFGGGSSSPLVAYFECRVFSCGRVVWPSALEGSKGVAKLIFERKILFSALNKFKIIEKIETNLIDNCNYLKDRNYCQERPL